MCGAAGAAAAQASRPAPDYFVTGAFETSTAQILALSCPSLSVDLGAMARRSGEVLDRLTADGFTPRTLESDMSDPAPAIAALQDAFRTRRGLPDGASEAEVCAAGAAEIAEGTGIGALLLELEP